MSNLTAGVVLVVLGMAGLYVGIDYSGYVLGADLLLAKW